jgi:hypothetical protein
VAKHSTRDFGSIGRKKVADRMSRQSMHPFLGLHPHAPPESWQKKYTTHAPRITRRCHDGHTSGGATELGGHGVAKHSKRDFGSMGRKKVADRLPRQSMHPSEPLDPPPCTPGTLAPLTFLWAWHTLEKKVKLHLTKLCKFAPANHAPLLPSLGPRVLSRNGGHDW